MPKRTSQPKTLIFYIHSLYAGGAERVWAQLASSFAARGHRVIFAVNKHVDELDAPLHKDVEQVILGNNHLRAIFALRKLIITRKADCTLAACSPNNFKLAIAALLAGTPRRTIISYHGFLDNETGHFGRWPYLAISLLSRFTGHTVAVSNALRENLVDRLKSSPSRTRTIYNPVVTKAPAKPRAKPAKEKAPNILAAGRLIPQKHFDTLIKAFAALPDKKSTLTILGRGPARDDLEKLVDELGLKKRVSLPGFMPNPTSYFKKANCFAMPSDKESFSLVIIEAFSFGLPVVATNNGGPVELINNPALGELVEVGDVAALSDALARQLKAPANFAVRRKRYLEFSLKNATDQYNRLINELVD